MKLNNVILFILFLAIKMFVCALGSYSLLNGLKLMNIIPTVNVSFLACLFIGLGVALMDSFKVKVNDE